MEEITPEKTGSTKKVTIKIVEYIVKILTLRFLDKPDELTEDQVLALEIVKLFLLDKTNEVLWSPDSARYIKSSDTFIKVRLERITIINHSYQYDIWLPQFTYSKLLNNIDEEIEIRRKEMEAEIMKNITNSLQEIKLSFKERIEHNLELKQRFDKQLEKEKEIKVKKIKKGN